MREFHKRNGDKRILAAKGELVNNAGYNITIKN
jgi:hypothetical protein